MVRTVLQVGECVVCYMKARLRKITIVLCVCCVTTWTELSMFIFSHIIYTRVSYSYYKIVQSECCLYCILYSAKTCTQKSFMVFII